MDMHLYQDLCNALHNARQTAVNGYLQLLAPYVKDMESASSSEPTLSDYCNRMRALVQRQNFALDGNAINDFCQLFGEAHFLTLCGDRGVSIAKVPERKDSKTPDFVHQAQEPLYFEVKTLSVVNGGGGINQDLESALDAQIQVEEQLKKGRRISIGEATLQPHGTKPYRDGHISAAINTLIEKARQNIKTEQYANPNTFLVLNLCLIPPTTTVSCSLRPAYCDDHRFPTPVTGDLWMLAFAQPGMLIQSVPEYEGSQAIEGTINKAGILTDPDFNCIAGLLIVVYPLGKRPHLYGLFRYPDYNRWSNTSPELIKTLTDLTGQFWNDDGDSNGWRLRSTIGA